MAKPIIRSASRPFRGFSLIEVLVVIGIIAVLIGLMIPSLARAREQAKLAACSSHLRQLAIAMQMYTDSNHDRFPAPAWAGDPEPDDWIYWQKGRVTAQGVLTAYLGRSSTPGSINAAILRCPSDDYQVHQQTVGLNGQPDQYQYSYAFNERVCNHDNRKNGVATLVRGHIKSPSKKILVIDESTQTIRDGCWYVQNDIAASIAAVALHHSQSAGEYQPALPGSGNAAFATGIVKRSSGRTPFCRPTTIRQFPENRGRFQTA